MPRSQYRRRERSWRTVFSTSLVFEWQDVTAESRATPLEVVAQTGVVTSAPIQPVEHFSSNYRAKKGNEGHGYRGDQ